MIGLSRLINWFRQDGFEESQNTADSDKVEEDEPRNQDSRPDSSKISVETITIATEDKPTNE
jgi:hypothetical protein